MDKKKQDPLLRPKVGVGICVVDQDKVLLGKRKGSHGAGCWSFPGGHLEYGEGAEECAKRELAEETGLKALSLSLGPWTNDLIEPEKHYITLVVFVEAFTGTPALLEPEKCEGWQWFSWNALPSPLFVPIQSLIKKVGISTLEKWHEIKNENLSNR